MGATWDPVYGADDPRRWRNECIEPGEIKLLKDVLDEWKSNHAQLKWIGFPRSGWPHIWTEESEGFDVSPRCLLYVTYWVPEHGCKGS